MTPKSAGTRLQLEVPNLTDVAWFFAVRPDTVSKDWISGGMPGSKGHYDLKAIYDWKMGRERDPSIRSALQADAGEVRARRQLALAMKTEEEAAAKRFKRLQMEGQYWHRDDVKIAHTSFTVQLRSRLLALGGRLAVLVPAAVKAVTKKLVEETVSLALKEAYEAAMFGTTPEQMILDEADRIRAERASS